MTDAKRHRTGKAVASDDLGYITFYGNDIGATSYAAKDADDREKHPAEYTVDFDKKILKGELIKNQYVQKRNDPKEPKKPLTIYNITADLNGNRFTGSAKVNTEVKTRHADKEYLFFHTDADQRLEGGFFGDNGEELAGRFISNDNGVFGVFAGKQKTNASGTNPAMPFGKHTKILDSLKISVDEATDENPRPFEVSTMPDFGHPDKLLVEGREIPLVSKEKTIDLADGRKMTVSACCDFLTYVKLGRIKTERPAVKPRRRTKRIRVLITVKKAKTKKSPKKAKTKFPKMITAKTKTKSSKKKLMKLKKSKKKLKRKNPKKNRRKKATVFQTASRPPRKP